MGTLNPNNVYTTLRYISDHPNSDVNSDELCWMLDPIAGNPGYFATLGQAGVLRVSGGRATITEKGEKLLEEFESGKYDHTGH